MSTEGEYLTDQTKRGDVSGLDFSEIRLKAGFVNVAVPFIYAPSIRDLIAIACPSEMAPWRLGNFYDRSIPRRIVESVGVPCDAFGQEKMAVMRRLLHLFHRELRREFLAYLHDRHGCTPTYVYYRRVLGGSAYRINRAINVFRALFRMASTLVARGDVEEGPVSAL